ncbi:mediator of RNA polymerase II transcription subunit 8 isoform X2 [Argentina anserina]|uniref:mediator of RNA polymerase II transcription subunit 8 isoform X2 n=1 Tax=Argentina anserina TaxID=57926 RepID=UPI00217691F6|nr:mediator of RNA polymerase II transcription subunit 8 isoform X2 [Potentilla anserina]
MAAMEAALQNQPPPPPLQPQPQPAAVERLNDAVCTQLNLKSVKERASNLFKQITSILEVLHRHAQINTAPNWPELLSQYSMVNMELFNIVNDIANVSKAFVVYPKNVNAENAVVLPVMLSSKLLPEMEVEDGAKREQLLLGLQSLPISTQIEKLTARISMIKDACDSAEKVLADTRKAYCIGTRQGIAVVPTLDKAQAAKIQEQENLLRAAVNYGEALRLPVDRRQNPPALPMHLVDVLSGGDGVQAFPEASGMYSKNTPLSSSNLSGQSPLMQVPGSQLMGRSGASPGGTSITNFDNTTSPLPYANSPRSSTNIMNTPSPQQQQKQQLHQIQQQHQQKLMQLPQHQQQLLAQQQFRQSAMQGLGQSSLQQLHDLQGQAQQQKFQSLHGQHQMQFSPSMGHQQFQGRQLPSGHVSHGIGQNQLNPGSQMNRHLTQFSGATTPNQMLPNMSATMSSQSVLPRMQFELPGNNPQRSHASQILSDQMFNMGATNTGGMMPIQQQQQQQHGSQGSFGNMAQNVQNLQSNMVQPQGTPQNQPNFSQQRQQNQQQ